MHLGSGWFFGVLEAERSVGPFRCALRSADPHRTVVRHSHEDAHFVLVMAGLYSSAAHGAPAIAHEPLLVFNPAGTTHRDRFESVDGRYRGRFLSISIPPEFAPQAGAVAHTEGVSVALRTPEALAMAYRVANACSGRASDSASLIENGGWELLGLLESAGRDERADPAWLKRVRERICDDMVPLVSVTELAREAGVHPVHLARVFRKAFGVGPAEYRRQRRRERALALIRHTDRTLSAIAHETGFVDQSHMAKAVRQLSPAE